MSVIMNWLKFVIILVLNIYFNERVQGMELELFPFYYISYEVEGEAVPFQRLYD